MNAPGRSFTGGEVVVETLRALGAATVFGLPGQHALAIWDALARSRVRAVHFRTELAATFAADGYARVSGQPAPVLLSTGPGALNSLAGLMEAASSYVPIVAIATQIERKHIGRRRGVLHELADQRASFAPVVKWSTTAASAESIAPLIEAAWHTALAPPSGPVFVEIPTDLLDEQVTLSPEDSWPGATTVEAASRLVGQDGAIDLAVEWLATAERPVIWAGGGVLRSGAWDALRDLAELLQMPVATTYMGKGAMNERHPLALGSACADDPVRSALTTADVVLCVGTELGAESTQEHTLELPERLIQIDASPERIGATYPALGLVGDAGMLLRDLRGRCESQPARGGPRFQPRRVDDSSLEMRMLRDIRAALPDEACTFWDSTLLGYWAAAYFETYLPRTFAYPVGSGTIGYGWPAAIGGQLAAPDRPVLAVSGDGGVLYGLVELGTAAQFGIPVKLLLIEDQSYGVLKRFQERTSGRPSGVELAATDFAAVAGGFGVPARTASVEQLGDGVSWAFEQEGPAVVLVEATLDTPPGI